VIYGLSDYRFSTFPRGCPLILIVAREDKSGNSVEITIKTLSPVDKNIRLKQKDGRWVILLTPAPMNDFAWSAQGVSSGAPQERIPAEAPSAAPARGAAMQVTASSFLEDITILHRERVEKVIFKFDAPTEMIVKSMPDQIMVLFVNSKNSLSHGTFKSEKDWLVKSIILKEVAHGATTWLGASIFIKREDGVKPLVQTFPDRLVIYSVRDTKQCLYLWSARNGTTLSYDFITPQRYPVDYKNIEKKALTDSKADMGKNGTFSVGEPVTAAKAGIDLRKDSHESAEPSTPRAVRIVIIKNTVNVRSGASASPSSTVVGKLPMGAVGTRVGKRGQWLNVEFGDTHGWIMAALAVDSGKVSKAQWNNIEAIRTAKEKQEEKAREAVRKQQERKALMEQAALQKERARQEGKERIAHDAADKPAAVANHPSDSAAPTPLRVFPKTIEYHVFGRDPFLTLSQDEDGPLPTIENLELVGILYDAMDRIGLFEDIRNKTKAYALRENDPIKNGSLLRIQSDKVLFLINELGISRTYAMKLNKEKEPKAYEAPKASKE
jgi:hypothetical protein